MGLSFVNPTLGAYMKRRDLIKISAAVILSTGFTVPARAFAPPVVVALASVAISVAFRRYVVGALTAWFAKMFPRFFATELRKYLIAVAMAFGMGQAKAAFVAEHAENSGAEDLARDGQERITELEIHNDRDKPLELPRLNLLLVDVESNTVELKSSSSLGLVVFPKSTMIRQITSSRFPKPGLKRWYLSDPNRTLAISKPFMVVA